MRYTKSGEAMASLAAVLLPAKHKVRVELIYRKDLDSLPTSSQIIEMQQVFNLRE